MQKTAATTTGSRQAGLRGIRTASSVCIRSAKPPVQGQHYLDLYVLQRDRARWEQLKQRAELMIHGIDKALNRLGLKLDYAGRLTSRPAKNQARRPAIVFGGPARCQRAAKQADQRSAGVFDGPRPVAGLVAAPAGKGA